MASSSSSSRTTAKTQSSDEFEEKRHSPIPYRVGPLDYHPPVGGCAFMCWYECRHDALLETLLVDLRNVVWSLKKEKIALNKALGEASARLDLMEKKLAAVKKEEEDKVDALKSEKEDLKAEVRKLEVEKTRLKALCVFFVATVLFMWIGNQ
ncbi:hypothetical protein QOZ80_8BG0654880 [Eleusine coracana subsp. coracana]|nr:hypothetical protein QOZ80_8BG0654880 [Eleusine coracana subsp. coracana]